MRYVLTLALCAVLVAPCVGQDFAEPVLVTADGAPIQVESPGYAAPCLADVDGDGIDDLLVGQFNKGKISLYRGLPDGAGYAAHAWLTAGDEVATVPGVW